MRHARTKRRRPMGEINVVPYIDVMLVLLVIFMITAPLLTQGVDVDLPSADAKPLPPDIEDPVVVTVDVHGNMFLNVGAEKDMPVDDATVTEKVAAVLRQNPKVAVLVRGDKAVEYGRVMAAMVVLQKAGAPNVGLITEPPEG